MKKLMNILLLSCIFAVSYSQTRTICGTITDPLSGEAVIGATIVIKGTTIGTITDFNGKYCIEAEVGSILVVKSMTFKEKMFYVGSRKTEVYNNQRASKE